MPELIDRHALLKNVYDIPPEKARMTQGEWCRKCIYEAPTIEAEPVRRGRWIIVDDVEHFIAKCSECGAIEDSRRVCDYPYCHCGAKMDGGAENAST